MSKISAIKFEKKPRKALCQIELEYIRQACQTAKERAIIEILYSTGCRIAELAHMKRSDIDFDRAEVHLVGKGNKHRISYLNAKATVALREYFEIVGASADVIVSDRVPHETMSISGISKIVRQIVQRLDGKVDKKISPHVFRHTTATVAIQNGMPVQDLQKMLGHSQIGTTMIYAEVNEEEVKTMHKKCII